jgi:hypothetical protein
MLGVLELFGGEIIAAQRAFVLRHLLAAGDDFVGVGGLHFFFTPSRAICASLHTRIANSFSDRLDLLLRQRDLARAKSIEKRLSRVCRNDPATIVLVNNLKLKPGHIELRCSYCGG